LDCGTQRSAEWIFLPADFVDVWALCGEKRGEEKRKAEKRKARNRKGGNGGEKRKAGKQESGNTERTESANLRPSILVSAFPLSRFPLFLFPLSRFPLFLCAFVFCTWFDEQTDGGDAAVRAVVNGFLAAAPLRDFKFEISNLENPMVAGGEGPVFCARGG